MKKVLVAMSGGVDSSVAAALLIEKGYQVSGGTIDAFFEKKSISDAREIAKRLDIPFYVFDFKKEFKQKIINNFIAEYNQGITPNPCVLCNQEIKFGLLMGKAKELKLDYLATGHYATVIHHQTGRQLLKKAVDREKEQSYMLYGLSQEQLKHTLFPLGQYHKSTIREIAKDLGLFVHDKAESQDICFIPDGNYAAFLKQQSPELVKTGPILDVNGKQLGIHKGLHYYTIGQRKGLGIASPDPLYVVRLDKKNNAVIVGRDQDVFNRSLLASSLNWIAVEEVKKPMTVAAKIRYNSAETAATIYPIDGERIKVVFKEKQRAITPGQSVVFYQEDIVLGGGIIAQVGE